MVVQYIFTIIFLALAFGLTIGLFESRVEGAECVPVYGGGEVCPKVATAFVDKTVLNKTTGQYVDNLTESDPRFAPQDIAVFRIIIKNTGQVTINEVVVKDVFPQHVSFHSGIGRHENGTVTIEVGELAPGESREFFLRGAVAKQEELPADKTIICPVINRVEMRGKVDEEIFVSDAAQFCVEKQILGKGAVVVPEAKEIPAAGAGSLLLITSSLFTAGVIIRKWATV